jgi:carbonic anhydrase
MSVLLILLFFVVMIGLFVALYLYNSKKEKERTLAMQQAAQALGWEFAPESHLGMIPYAGSFSLFNQGHSKSIKNMIYGQRDGAKVAAFDYRYTVGHGKNSHTYNQSVLYFESPRLQLPMFTLSPENFMHKFISALGYQDIDFSHRPEFSKRYLLRGQDEQGVRQAFTDHILSFYEANQGFHTEGGGNQLFVYRLSRRVPPQEISQYVQWGATSILPLFQRLW